MENHLSLSLGKTKAQLPLIFQNERIECGQACITMIANYWGHTVDLHYIKHLSPTSLQGTTLFDLIHLSEKLNLTTRALKVPLEEIAFIKTPAILHWDMNHFVVLKQVKKKSIIIHDPAKGICSLSYSEFAKYFTGVVLEIEKKPDFKSLTGRSTLSLYQIFQSISGISHYISLLLFLTLAIEIFSLAQPLLMQYVTDNIIGTGDGTSLITIGLGFVILIMAHITTDFIRGHIVIFLNNNLTAQFAANVVKHLLKLPLEFFEKRTKGDLQAKFHAIEFIQRKLTTDFITALLDGIMLTINLFIMLLYSVRLTSIVMIILGCFILIRFISYHSLKKQTEQAILESANANTLFLETLQGILPIKSFSKEHTRFNAWQNGYINALNADIGVARLNVYYNLINQILFQSEHLIVLCLGASYVIANQLSLGMLMAFLSYRLAFVSKSLNLIQNWFDYKLIDIHLNRLNDILIQTPEDLQEGCGERENVQGNLRAVDLSFAFSANEPFVFNNLNLEVNAGEKVAIVGGSGVGKTTLLKVMMGLLPKSGGKLFIDNIPLNEFGLKQFRKISACVMQDDSLISGSILDNIAFFDERVDAQQVYVAAKLAAIHEEIQLFPMGYESLVGDMGSMLSGGQKQRILLARALYKKPKFLFLDESTSHLDTHNEAIINANLKALNVTQIIVAHRQETINMADRVIKLLPLKTT